MTIMFYFEMVAELEQIFNRPYTKFNFVNVSGVSLTIFLHQPSSFCQPDYLSVQIDQFHGTGQRIAVNN